MAKYSDIKGFTVQTLSSDPAASVIATGSWASAPSLNAANREGGGSGTPTSAINVGGYPYPMTNEQWNGSSWSTFTNLNTQRGKNSTAGDYTNAITSAGATPSTPGYGTVNNNETWDGSSWTEVNDLNTIRESYAMTGAGTRTAAFVISGSYSPGKLTNVESFDGSSWSETTDINTARITAAGVGTTTAGLLAGGETTTHVGNTESWNGSAWTEVNDLNNARRNTAGNSSTYTDCLVFGGRGASPLMANTESWDGTSWTEVNDLGTARHHLKGSGTASTSALAFGGYTTTDVANTEEWTTTATPTTLNKITEGQLYFNSTTNTFKETINDFAGATWGSGASLNTARERMGGASQGTPSAGLVCGGPGSPYGQTEEYNGTAWSEQNDLNEGRYISGGGCGTQTALVYAGGYDPAGSPNYDTNNSETYNGTSWTEGNDLNEGRIDCYSVGTATAGMLIGGAQAAGGPGTVDSVELYDGTSWTETTNLPTVTQEMGALGLQTASLIFGGSVDTDPSTKNTTIEWNGTSWTASNNYPFSVKYTTAFGSQTSGIAAGGEKIPGGGTAVCNRYDGTSWTEIAELSTARTSLVGNGAASSNGLSGFVAGGYAPGGTTAVTEELTVSLGNKTITTS